MATGVPDTCPKCGSNRVGKERIMGMQTGDWICGNCGETDSIKRAVYPPKKDHDEKEE
ncbi:Eag protein [Escherichia sp. E10V10]|uniref:Eag protein n=1 Tax=Escherichia sp. E10V10 TaxID=2478970 RepID=UPI000D16219C|nr:Eag protein [Escherichia sp. E10V10]PSZ18442.1 Eag protein [Escherichia sp. 4726-5]RZN54861.1 Eag protein [Escherichia sp. E10V10]